MIPIIAVLMKGSYFDVSENPFELLDIISF